MQDILYLLEINDFAHHKHYFNIETFKYDFQAAPAQDDSCPVEGAMDQKFINWSCGIVVFSLLLFSLV